jgi:hypothetical protein
MYVCVGVCVRVRHTHRRSSISFPKETGQNWVCPLPYRIWRQCLRRFRIKDFIRESAARRAEMLVKPARQNGDKNDQETRSARK